MIESGDRVVVRTDRGRETGQILSIREARVSGDKRLRVEVGLPKYGEIIHTYMTFVDELPADCKKHEVPLLYHKSENSFFCPFCHEG